MRIIKNKGKEPIIYIRYHGEKILYIGETEDKRKGRPFRDEPKIGDWDYVKLLKAPSNVKRRKYWEAYLICKLKPLNMDTYLYFKLVKKQNQKTTLPEDFTDPEELKKAREEISIHMLNQLRRKNNKERTLYWANQIKLAEFAKKQALGFFKHFYTHYMHDKELDKKERLNSEKK
jgi:hypothetical protein